MSDLRLRRIAASGLVVGAVLGMAGTFAPSASLALVSASGAMPPLVKGFGFIGSLLFTIVAVQIFLGRALTPLSQPLPFYAYPFLVATLFGWAWVHSRNAG